MKRMQALGSGDIQAPRRSCDFGQISSLSFCFLIMEMKRIIPASRAVERII